MATTTSTTTSAPASPAAIAAEVPFLTPQRIRLLGIAGAAVLLIVLVVWFVITAGRRKEAFAATALEQARNAAAESNFGVAVQGFNKVVSGFGGTPAAYEASLGIAQTHLVAGQNELAVTSLTDFLHTNPPQEYAASANGLLGTAYENLSKYAEAEAAYRKSSELATADYQKAAELIEAGRAARLARKLDDAKTIYNEIITKFPKTASMTEAQVRLAEISAGS